MRNIRDSLGTAAEYAVTAQAVLREIEWADIRRTFHKAFPAILEVTVTPLPTGQFPHDFVETTEAKKPVSTLDS